MIYGAAIGLALVVLAASACGGSKSASKTNLPPRESVRQAAAKTVAQRSEHLALKGSVTVNGQPVVVSGNGDFKNRAGSLKLDFNLGGLSGSVDAVVQGTVLYLRSPLLSSTLPKGKTWVKYDLAKQARTSGSGLDLSRIAAQDPAQTLTQLGALSHVTALGSDHVGGVDAMHYRGRLAASSTRQPGTYDVWVGNDDGYVHRVMFSSRLAPGQRLAATIDLSDFGKQVTISVPPASQTAAAPTSTGG